MMIAFRVLVFLIVSLTFSISALAAPADILQPLLGEYEGVDSALFWNTPCQVNIETEQRDGDNDEVIDYVIVRTKLIRSEDGADNVYHYARSQWKAEAPLSKFELHYGSRYDAVYESTDITVTLGANNLPAEVRSTYEFRSPSFTIPPTQITCKNLLKK